MPFADDIADASPMPRKPAPDANAAIEAFADAHTDRCPRCADNRPCAVLVRIVGVYWR